MALDYQRQAEAFKSQQTERYCLSGLRKHKRLQPDQSAPF